MVDSAPLSSASAGIEHTILRRNFFANVLDGAFFSFGMSFVSIQTVLPVFIKKIGGGNVAIGLIPVFWIISFNFPQILMRERNYRNFLITDALQYLALMANAFFTVYALEKFSLADSYAGTFTAIMMGSMIIGNIFFGYLADRYGHRINLILSASMIVVSCCLALLTPGIDVYYIVFIGIAFTLSLSQISRLPIIADFCSEELRPTYIALTNLISSPFILSGILGGWLANRYGYNIIFLISGGIALLALIWWLTIVKEPRKYG